MVKNDSLVSIGIPTYNRPKELKRALDSVISQTYKNLEIIISDNCSEDVNVETLCKEYAEKDSRIKYYRQDRNLGIGGNGQFLINSYTGDYTFILCDDDWISENYIEESIKAFITDPSISMVYGETRLYNGKYELIETTCLNDSITGAYSERLTKYILNAVPYRLATAFFKTEYLKTISDYSNDRFCEDQIYMSKMLYFGNLVILPNITFHKLNNGSTKNLETLRESFSLDSINPENFNEKRINTILEAIMFDSFFEDKFNRYQRIELVTSILRRIFEKDNEIDLTFINFLRSLKRSLKKERI